MIRVPKFRTSTYPGEMLREEFLKPMKISSQEFAATIGVSQEFIETLTNGCGEITPATARRFADFFGISAAFWMNLQERWNASCEQNRE